MIHRYLFCLLGVMMICTPGLWAQDGHGNLLEVSRAAISPEIIDLRPVDAGVRFPATVGKLYCFSRISNIEAATRVQHVWYFNNTERARVDLAVNPPSWRTFSSKRILSGEIGRWRIDILDSDGNVLKTLGFDIVP
jgi:hypothetical protein